MARRNALAVTGAVLLAACSTLAVPPTPRHGAADMRLRERMQQLNVLTRDRLPQAMDLRHERTRRRYAVAHTARDIAESASALGRSANDLGFDLHRHWVFAAHAAALERRANALARNAVWLSPSALRTAVSEINATCEGCHRELRVRPPLPPLPSGQTPGG